jgi:hypothetical protein
VTLARRRGRVFGASLGQSVVLARCTVAKAPPTGGSSGQHVNPTITTLVQNQTFVGDKDITEANNNTEYRNCTFTGTLGIVPASAGSSPGPHDIKLNGCTAQMLFQRASSNILMVDTAFSGPLVDTQNQIKGYNGFYPTNCEYLRTEWSHVSRTAGVHVEGLYVLAMDGGWFTDCQFFLDEVMDLNFQSDVADNTGQIGKIQNVTVTGGRYDVPTPTGTNSIYIASDPNTVGGAPSNVVIDTTGMTVGGGIKIEQTAFNNGCRSIPPSASDVIPDA